jgi:hypothetical protein
MTAAAAAAAAALLRLWQVTVAAVLTGFAMMTDGPCRMVVMFGLGDDPACVCVCVGGGVKTRQLPDVVTTVCANRIWEIVQTICLLLRRLLQRGGYWRIAMGLMSHTYITH